MAGLKEIKEEGTAGKRIIQLILKATKQSSILPSQYIVIAEGKQSRLSFIRKTLPLHQNLLRVQELGQACPYPHSPQKNQSFLSVSMKLFLMEEERFSDSAEKEISINAVNSAGDNLQKKPFQGLISGTRSLKGYFPCSGTGSLKIPGTRSPKFQGLDP